MATKETTKNTATVAAKTAQAVAEQTLKRNPEMKEVHVTSDGTAFFTRNDALNHANTLKNREVYSIKRSALTPATAATKTAAKTSAKKTETKTEEPKVDELTGEPVEDIDNVASEQSAEETEKTDK